MSGLKSKFKAGAQGGKKFGGLMRTLQAADVKGA
jgi:hypothetical protein